jgi:hypothetical protein
LYNMTTDLYFDGNLNVGSGQLGLTVIDTLTSSPIDLWTEYPQKPHYYVLDPDGVDREVRLPGVGGVSAIIGHSVFIKNVSTTNTITVKNAGGVSLIRILAPTEASVIIAKDSPNDWTLISVSDEDPVNTFIDHGDTPSSYTGNANKVLSVNSGETAVEFSENLVGTTTDVSGESITLGKGSTSGSASLSIGKDASTVDSSSAIGPGAISRIEHATNISGGQFIRKARGETLGGAGVAPGVVDDLVFDKFTLFSGAQICLGSEEIDFSIIGPTEYRVRFPTGYCFYLDSVNIIQTIAGTGSGSSGSISIGDSTGATAALPSTPYADDVSIDSRTRFTFLGDFDKASDFVSITVDGVASGGKFRCFWRGLGTELES